jgi:hypothetical protein
VTSRRGPLEASPWPETLDAHAVSDEDDVLRLHGYDVEADVAAHYRFSDALYLAIKGELPDDSRSRAFEIAMTFALPLSVAEAPVHAAALARICGARPSGVASVASLALAEQTSDAVRSLLPVLRGEAEPLADVTPRAAASVARLRALLTGVRDVPLLDRRPSRELAILAVLWACDLRTEWELVHAMTLARLPSAVAESGPRRPLDFASYPTTTPPIDYTEG